MHPTFRNPQAVPLSSQRVRLSSSSCREAVTERSVGGGLLCTAPDPVSPALLSPRARRRPVTLRRGERLPSATFLVPTSWPARSSCREKPPPKPRFLSFQYAFGHSGCLSCSKPSDTAGEICTVAQAYYS